MIQDWSPRFYQKFTLEDGIDQDGFERRSVVITSFGPQDHFFKDAGFQNLGVEAPLDDPDAVRAWAEGGQETAFDATGIHLLGPNGRLRIRMFVLPASYPDFRPGYAGEYNHTDPTSPKHYTKRPDYEAVKGEWDNNGNPLS